MQPTARVVADSISRTGRRLTTMEVLMHRFVLAEFNTHRAFSRNSASSRAIPFRKQVNRVDVAPAVPVSFPKEQSGMQGGEELEGLIRDMAKEEWLAASQSAIEHAHRLARLGVHKSVVNRILEPFMWHTVIVSSTDWRNFFKQRCSPLAQPEIRTAAEAMQVAYDKSTPQRVDQGEWHLPYIETQDRVACDTWGVDPKYVSAARCARVSYLTHEGVRDVREDDKMARFKLIPADPPHMSPFEHVATPSEEFAVSGGNFRGWVQLRTQIWGVTL